jgi:hypothetical protein
MTITSTAGARGSDPDERARATEEQLTDDERFSLIISLSGATRFTGGVRDKRYPDEVGTGFAGRYPSRRVGGGSIVELRVPAEELTDCNCHIVGQIRVVTEFPGEAARP